MWQWYILRCKCRFSSKTVNNETTPLMTMKEDITGEKVLITLFNNINRYSEYLVSLIQILPFENHGKSSSWGDQHIYKHREAAWTLPVSLLRWTLKGDISCPRIKWHPRIHSFVSSFRPYFIFHISYFSWLFGMIL